MNALFKLWQKLSGSKKYREAFVTAQLKRGVPTQIQVLRKQRGWSQADLAQAAGLTQGVISRAENPDYGNLTFNTILQVAAGFDVAFIGRFVPFSDLARWFANLSEEALQVPSFKDDPLAEKKGPDVVRSITRYSPIAVVTHPIPNSEADSTVVSIDGVAINKSGPGPRYASA